MDYSKFGDRDYAIEEAKLVDVADSLLALKFYFEGGEVADETIEKAIECVEAQLHLLKEARKEYRSELKRTVDNIINRRKHGTNSQV